MEQFNEYEGSDRIPKSIIDDFVPPKPNRHQRRRMAAQARREAQQSAIRYKDYAYRMILRNLYDEYAAPFLAAHIAAKAAEAEEE